MYAWHAAHIIYTDIFFSIYLFIYISLFHFFIFICCKFQTTICGFIFVTNTPGPIIQSQC